MTYKHRKSQVKHLQTHLEAAQYLLHSPKDRKKYTIKLLTQIRKRLSVRHNNLPVHYSQMSTKIWAAHTWSLWRLFVSFSYAVKLLKFGKQQSQSDPLRFSSTAISFPVSAGELHQLVDYVSFYWLVISILSSRGHCNIYYWAGAFCFKDKAEDTAPILFRGFICYRYLLCLSFINYFFTFFPGKEKYQKSHVIIYEIRTFYCRTFKYRLV